MNERMKRRKGFTLIELLAVIVILAIIALIAIPSIIKILNKTRLSAAIDSAYGILSSAETYVANQMLLNKDSNISDLTFEANDGRLCVSQNDCLSFKGTKPSSGYVYILNNGSNFVLENLVINGFTCNKPIFEDKVTCEKTKSTEIIDENEGVICGDSNTEDYDNLTECYIKSIADYKEFTDLVNSGKSFSGKTVYLSKSLDLNGVTLEPIGNNNNKFEGTFEGNGYTLKNIKIESDNDYVGMFGYNTGTIRGFNVENIIVKGNDNVGGIVGYNVGNVMTIIVTSTVEGNDYVGGLVGNNNFRSETKNVLVRDTDVSGNNYVGGISGMVNNGKSSGIVENGNIVGKNSVKCTNGWTNTTNGTYCSNEVKINNNLNSSGYMLGSNMLAYYNQYLDTIYGGDNDSDGYYFDYDNKGKLIIKLVNEYSYEFNLKGSGTLDDPYQIKNVDDFNNAAININEERSSAAYSIMNDIDFSNKKSYIFGIESVPFKGTFNGNGYKLKNINIESTVNYVGVFGCNEGTIENLNFENINIKGNNYVGGIIGYNKDSGTIIGFTAENTNVKGNDNVGGIVGYNVGNVMTIIVTSTVEGNDYVGGLVGNNNFRSETKNVLVRGTNVSGNNYVGGISGMVDNGKSSGIVENGNIVGKNSVKCTNGWTNTTNGTYCSSNTTINGVNVTGSNVIDLTKVTDFNTTYKTYLDTESDSDSDGYYFIYDSNKKSMILKKA